MLPNPDENHKRWVELTHQAGLLEMSLPSSFQPIHFRDPDLDSGKIFPETWYLDNYHVAAAAYIELTKILLASFNSRRPKFGSG